MTKLFEQALQQLAEKKNWVLDVDDAMYPIDSGLHAYIKGNITRTFNHVAWHDPKSAAIVKRFETILRDTGQSVQNPLIIKEQELGVAFAPIVQSLAETYPDRLFDYLGQFYGSEYHRVEKDPALTEAFTLARNKGIEIFFYTNGPSSMKPGELSHLQRVMTHRGFSTEMIEFMRARTYDLLMAVNKGRAKPDPRSMQDFIGHFGIDPEDAVMADDSTHNLKTARDAGMEALWTWTTDAAPVQRDLDAAEQHGLIRVRDTGAAVLAIAQARQPK